MRRFEDLPEDMRTPEVKEYYDCLAPRRAYRFAKRAFDIAGAAVLTGILAIPMLIIAAQIKMSSPGPVFFRQTRVTRYGKTFRIFKFRTMEDYERLKKVNEARRKSQSKYIDNNLIKNVREYSNGESSFKYFTEKIKQNSLYLLDEPENSLSPKRQIELMQYIEDSARFYNCQFIISTHSPFLLSMKNVKIYNLDIKPVETSKWTELENVRTYFEFFKRHRHEFEE